MKLLGVILTLLIIGFVIMTPVWTVIECTAKAILGITAGSIFYAVWKIAFPKVK